ncbi:MAG: DUF3460 family protein [Limnohabitans sp.]|jgi:hypothetical protein|nr:DUF3460 family protein [Limnohabitans sp.]
MPIFQRPDYQSETTQFLQELKAKKPDLDRQQREGRALLWDKAVDRAAWQEFKAARVPQKPYVYQTQG